MEFCELCSRNYYWARVLWREWSAAVSELWVSAGEDYHYVACMPPAVYLAFWPLCQVRSADHRWQPWQQASC